MINQNRLKKILDLMVSKGLMHPGQRQDVLNRGLDQARHILLDKRAELRRLMGRHRVSYQVSEIELISSFRFRRGDGGDGLITEESISKLVAEEEGLPFVVIDPLALDYRLVTDSFGGPFSERHVVVALEDADDALTIAVANPWDQELLESIARVKEKPIRPVMAQKSDILRVIVEFHGFRRSMHAAEEEFRGSSMPDLGNLEQLHELKELQELDATDQPIIRAVWYLLNYAIEHRASDIHVEPKREETWVRMRIDGVLHRIHRLPKAVSAPVLSRIKTLAHMDIAERRRPQDGRFKTQHQDMEVELRVSTVPTAFGEKAVIRIFDPQVLLLDLESLGFFANELTTFRGLLGHASGMILVTGPTGSGKTTTLYSSLHQLKSPRVNILTLEDPIEMVHEDFNQIAMHPKIGLTFGSALKNVLRQDPDVVMVGEVRDGETAENAIQAALTGHLVISTMHTSEASSTVGRMLDLDVLPFLLSSVLIGVVAQRLVRRVCAACARDVQLTEAQALALRIPKSRGRKLMVKEGVGCVKCRFTGYKGRTGLFEVMPVTPRISQLINERATALEIKREALNDGMLTLREYGIKKLALGETTFEEVVAVTDEMPVY